jgi:hypothetical protein
MPVSTVFPTFFPERNVRDYNEVDQKTRLGNVERDQGTLLTIRQALDSFLVDVVMFGCHTTHAPNFYLMSVIKARVPRYKIVTESRRPESFGYVEFHCGVDHRNHS